MVKAEDASKINRIMEEVELVPSGQVNPAPEAIDNGQLTVDNEGIAPSKEIDSGELTTINDGNLKEKNHSPFSIVNSQLTNPPPARTAKFRLSGPSYESRSRYERASSEPRASVRQELKDIAERRKAVDSPTLEKVVPTVGQQETQQNAVRFRVKSKNTPTKER